MDRPVTGGRPMPVLPKVTKVLKFDSTPPRYNVTIDQDGKSYTVECSSGQLLNYRSFRAVVFQQADRVLPHVSEWAWGRMIDGKAEVVKAPKEG